MTRLLIDPPVSPYSTAVELEAWLEELRAMEEQYPGDPTANKAVQEAVVEAERWLRMRAADG